MMKRARHLLRARLLTAYDLTVLDCLAHACRSPGQARLRVTYTRLCRLTALARPTVVKAIGRLVRHGLIERHAMRVRVGWATRVAANLYVLATEFTAPTANRELVKNTKKTLPPFDGSALDLALRGLQEALIDRRGQPGAAS